MRRDIQNLVAERLGHVPAVALPGPRRGKVGRVPKGLPVMRQLAVRGMAVFRSGQSPGRTSRVRVKGKEEKFAADKGDVRRCFRSVARSVPPLGPSAYIFPYPLPLSAASILFRRPSCPPLRDNRRVTARGRSIARNRVWAIHRVSHRQARQVARHGRLPYTAKNRFGATE